MPHQVFVGLGSNLADPRAQLAGAATRIAAIQGVRLIALSSLYASAPLGHAEQPDFVNAVARLATGLAPKALLAELQAIEAAHGRQRSFRNAPRTLDLDILLFDQCIDDDPLLTLPHPRCHQRAFVLLPLTEVAPDCVIPGKGPARDWIPACADQQITPIGPFPPLSAR